MRHQKTDPAAEKAAFSFAKVCGYLLSALIGVGGVCLLIACLLITGFEDPAMDVLFEKKELDYTTFLYAYDRQADAWSPYATLYADENRRWVALDKIAPAVPQALVAIEDERFYHHHGVDWPRFVGALRGYLTGNDSYGASTITQQLIKNLTGETERTWQRKAQEILRALYIERRYEKSEILEYYLNTVYFNYRTYGIEQAAQAYFGKPASALSVSESAALIGIINLPAYYEPYGHPENNEARRLTVLSKMAEQGYLSEEQAEKAEADRPVFRPEGAQSGKEQVQSYFTDLVIEDVLRDLSEAYRLSAAEAERWLYHGGLRIRTTVDVRAQRALEAAFRNEDNFPRASKPEQYQAAAMLMSPDKGLILAAVGARGEKTANRAYDRATMAVRQPGSSVKPLSVYLPALEYRLIGEGSLINDAPVTTLGGGGYPQNYSRRYYGRVSLFTALEQSLNASAAQVLMKVGLRRSYDFLTDSLRFSSLVYSERDMEGDVNLAALSMGAFTYGVTLREMVGGYGAIASGGLYYEPVSYLTVETAQGEILLSNLPEGERVCSEQAAFLMEDLLLDAVENGIAYPGRLSVPLAGKTGTSSENYDKWFMGITPYFVGGLWCGYDAPENLSRAGVSESVSKMVWHNVMQSVVDAVGWEGGKLLSRPTGLTRLCLCDQCGKRCFSSSPNAFSAWLRTGEIPLGICFGHR